MASLDDLDLDDPEAVMRQARLRFVDAFPGRMQSIGVLFDVSAVDRTTAPNGSLRQMVHQMVGIAGTLGLPTVSERAADLEQLVVAWADAHLPVTPDDVRVAMAALQQAFRDDLARPLPPWAVPPARPTKSRILVVDDDEELRHLLVASLRQAGYQVTAIGNGAEVLELAQMERPALVLLDIDLPGLGGHAVCRKLKTSPELSATPVIFMTTRASLTDRLTGQALGADDYLIKPIDPAELVVRIELLLRHQSPLPAAPPSHGQLLTYEAFLLAADEVLARESSSLAFMRLPARAEDATLAALAKEARGRDILTRYDARHALWLLPLAPLQAATARLREVSGRFPTLRASVVSAEAHTRTLETLLGEVNTALDAETVQTSVLLADDDPAIMRIVDAQLRAAGYRTELVFDGVAALDAVAAHHPAVLVLDLMMPKRTGFDVLGDLQSDPYRPKVIVLSARGREADVTRAFALGADDYMTKPFSPQELLARVARLAR